MAKKYSNITNAKLSGITDLAMKFFDNFGNLIEQAGDLI